MYSVQARIILLAIFLVQVVQCNLWDNLWSNNMADRVVFPPQFELKLSWNATVGGQRSVNNTNYVQGHIKIDQETNRIMMDTNFSTLSLAPQELVSYILDFDEKKLYLRQKISCKKYDIIPSSDDDSVLNVETMPNIAELFDLFPYVMYYNQTQKIGEQDMHEFKYSYPLSQQVNGEDEAQSELLAYFSVDSMNLDRLIVKANSFNIDSPFTLYANQPVT